MKKGVSLDHILPIWFSGSWQAERGRWTIQFGFGDDLSIDQLVTRDSRSVWLIDAKEEACDKVSLQVVLSFLGRTPVADR